MEFSQHVSPHIIERLSYARSKPIDLVSQEMRLKQTYRLHTLESQFGVSPKVQEVVQNFDRKAPLFPDTDAWELKQTLQKFFTYDPIGITVGTSIYEFLTCLLRLFAYTPSTKVLVPQLSNFEINRIVGLSGAKISMTPLTKDWVPNLDSLINNIDENTHMVIMSNPSIPIGSFLFFSEVKKLLDAVPKDVVVVIDESLIHYLGQGYSDLYPLIQSYPNLILLRSFSYAYGLAGFRVGYMLSCEEMANLINVVRNPYSVSALALECATAAVQDREFLQWVINKTNVERERYQSFCTYYNLFMLNTFTNSVTLNFASYAEKIYRLLMADGVFTRPLAYMGLPSLLNITIGSSVQNDKVFSELEMALKQN